MDDITKKKIERISKVVDQIVGDYSEAINRRDLDKLYERKESLKLKINSDTDEITRSNARLQLQEVERSIDRITGQIDIYRELDLDVDEEAAKKYIEENPDVFLDGFGDFEYE